MQKLSFSVTQRDPNWWCFNPTRHHIAHYSLVLTVGQRREYEEQKGENSWVEVKTV